ncbi:hypothetical protein EJB05_05161, partial [Eragrostis curvula]
MDLIPRRRPIAEKPNLGMDRLPQDALVAILSRLAPRSLAVSRCVCKEWRATIDACCKLRADLLPLSLGGIFVTLWEEAAPPLFFARPSMARKIDGNLGRYVELDFPGDFGYIENSCNGLLLLYGGFVVNPATRQWARLPPYPPSPDGFEGLRYDVDKCLVFDPTVSPHYEVLLLPYVPFNFEFKGNLLEGTTWPPSPCIIQVFSSRTGRWEQRSFILEGEPAGILADVKLCREPDAQRHAVYWRETVYVYCKGDFLMRLRLTDDNYQVIKLPASTTENEYIQLYLGKSKKGVYLAHPKASTDQLEIWFLNESDHKTEWVLKSSINVKALTKHIYQNHDEQTSKHWILQDRNNDDGNKGLVEEENLDWNSDDDNALNLEDWDPPGFWGYQTCSRASCPALAPRSLATSRAVCRWWRAAVDERGLLRTGHLPLWLGGIFVNLIGPAPSEFFARPSSPTARPEISGNLERYVTPSHTISDYPPSVACSCNGLLLVKKRVVNPATRQWARLPAYPPLPDGSADDCHECLVFDPAASMSPHYYEVLLVPYAYTNKRGGSKGKLVEGWLHREYWPPSPCVVHAYSSRTTRWEQRLFVRDQADQDAGTVVAADSQYRYCRSTTTYCHGALPRLTLSNDTYRVFKLPAMGVDDTSTWHLYHWTSIGDDPTVKLWTVQDRGSGDGDSTERSATVDENCLEWDSDDDNIQDIEDSGENLKFRYYIIPIFGFHPFQEVVLLRLVNNRIIAYHLNSTFKVQNMGVCKVESFGKIISDAFVYAPCWIRELFDA